MMIILATLILGVLVGALLLIKRAQNSGNEEVVKSKPTTDKYTAQAAEPYKKPKPISHTHLLLTSQLKTCESIILWLSDLNHEAKQVSKLYTRAEISLHCKKTDCWLIIKNKVYDVTPYVETHPGGDAILAHAGDDATAGFYGPQHASLVYDMIDEFYIGELEH